MSAPTLSIVIVNFNTGDLLCRCLGSLERQQKVAREVFVVDNASSDQSVEQVRQQFPGVTLITNRQNQGFARANNLALSRCRGRYVYFLNPDTELTDSDSLRRIVAYMEERKKVGLAATRLQFPDGRDQSCFSLRYPGQKSAQGELGALPGKIAWLLGASVVGRKEILEELGGFDERFFLYGEDLDLSLSVRKKGWELEVIEEVSVVHWEGQSERQTPKADLWRKKLNAEWIFYQKHYSEQARKAIRRKNILQARWRRASLSFSLCLGLGDRPSNLTKLERYRVQQEFFSGK